MIKCDGSKVTIDGNALKVSAEITMICKVFYDLVSKDLGKELARELVERSIEDAFMEFDDLKGDVMKQVMSLDKDALDFIMRMMAEEMEDDD